MAKRSMSAPSALPDGLYVIMSKRLVRGWGSDAEPGEFPRYAYWEPPDEPADSGWRVFVGDETQDEADDAAAFNMCAVDTLTTFHPALRQIVAVGVRGTWEWGEDEHRYVKVED